MAITKVTAVWTGFSGAPGYSNFFFRAFGGGDLVDAELARVRAAFGVWAGALPNSVRVKVLQEAAIHDEASGELMSYAVGEEDPAVVIGSGGTAFSAPSGGAVTWNTDAIARGRRLRGRTFFVPLASSGYDPDGTLTSAALGFLNQGAERLIGDGEGPKLVVWSRPQGGSGGSIGDVISHRVADTAAVLRSRRD